MTQSPTPQTVLPIDAPADMASLFLAPNGQLAGNSLSKMFDPTTPEEDVDNGALRAVRAALGRAREEHMHPQLAADVVAGDLALAISQGKASRADAVLVGAGALLLFVQNNYTGPSITPKQVGVFTLEGFALFGEGQCSPYKANRTDNVRSAIVSLLSQDSEEVYSLTPVVDLLFLARAILIDHTDKIFHIEDVADQSANFPEGTPQSLPWWAARVNFEHQRVLSDKSATLHDRIFGCFHSVNLDNCSSEVVARYHLEMGLAYHYYGEDQRSKTKFEQAQQASGLKWSVTGALGKRTKFQQKEVTQLALVAESSKPFDAKKDAMDVDEEKKPNTLELNDDTLLETIEYTEGPVKGVEGIDNTGSLSPLDQCILLAFCLNVSNLNPADGLTTEEMFPYVRRVLENANNWSVHTMALLLRSRLESKKSRTVERSVLQIQALVDQWDVTDSTSEERLQYIFGIDMPSRWNLERELGERFVSIGVTRSAMEIFEKLELWEDAISCMQMLEEENKAETLINKLLLDKPNSPKLYCLLGDLKKDPKYWQKAWDVSEGHYARAMRSLGAYHFRHASFKESVECYDKAMKINSLFENSWFVMGCAAMRIEDWDQAVVSLGRVTQLNPENGEAWTNIASVFVHLGRKRDAWRAMREGLRQHFDHPKMWENYLYISMDIGEFQEAILAVGRVLEIRWGKDKDEKNASAIGTSAAVDTGIVGLLIDAVTKDIPDAQGRGSSMYRSKLAKLIADISSKVTNDPVLYQHFAKFYIHFGQWIKGIDYLTKSYRVLLTHPDLLISTEVFEATSNALILLVDALVEYGPREETIGITVAEEAAEGENETDTETQQQIVPEETRVVCSDWKYQSRSNLRTLIGRTKDTYDGTEAYERLAEKMDFIKSL